MKCDPHGSINLNIKNGEHLGLKYASQLQVQLLFSFIISKLMLFA
jgi:hypothetical protein